MEYKISSMDLEELTKVFHNEGEEENVNDEEEESSLEESMIRFKAVVNEKNVSDIAEMIEYFCDVLPKCKSKIKNLVEKYDFWPSISDILIESPDINFISGTLQCLSVSLSNHPEIYDILDPYEITMTVLDVVDRFANLTIPPACEIFKRSITELTSEVVEKFRDLILSEKNDDFLLLYSGLLKHFATLINDNSKIYVEDILEMLDHIFVDNHLTPNACDILKILFKNIPVKISKILDCQTIECILDNILEMPEDCLIDFLDIVEIVLININQNIALLDKFKISIYVEILDVEDDDVINKALMVICDIVNAMKHNECLVIDPELLHNIINQITDRPVELRYKAVTAIGEIIKDAWNSKDEALVLELISDGFLEQVEELLESDESKNKLSACEIFRRLACFDNPEILSKVSEFTGFFADILEEEDQNEDHRKLAGCALIIKSRLENIL